MSNGLLSFTLGLGTGAFTGPLADASMKLKSFIGTVIGVGAIIEGVQRAFGKGAGLKELADQTGETIGNLYELERGFKAVGLDSESVGNTVFMLNKALGGINDNGEPTAAIFNQIGLSIQSLKQLNAPQALLAIANQINKLDASSATASAEKIFGRYNAREFLQLARNADEFADSLRKGGLQAAIFDRFGGAFERVASTIADIKENFSGLFLGVAEGLLPAVQAIVDWLDKIDFTKIGVGIGHSIGIIFEAIKHGQFEKLIGDGIMAGIEKAGNYLQNFLGSARLWDGIWQIAWGSFEISMVKSLKILVSIGDILRASIEAALDKVWENIAARFPKLAHLLGLEGFGKAESFSQHLAEDKAEGDPAQKMLDDWMKTSGLTVDAGKAEIKSALAEAAKNTGGPEQDEYNHLLESLNRFWNQDLAASEAAHRHKNTFLPAYNPQRTALEKMGFVFKGTPTGQDYARETARNTKSIADGITFIKEHVKNGSAGGTFGYSNPSLP
jgi:hypothetical protein